MARLKYTGREAFGDDGGTLASVGGDARSTIDLADMADGAARSAIRAASQDMPVVWFVDDERANREWFRKHHREHFATVTFSDRRRFRKALARRLRCDAIVTDIFFPAQRVVTDTHANRMLAIYDDIAQSPVADLHRLWRKERAKWALDGFKIAHDGASSTPPIPVFLFSRKALALLDVTELPCDDAQVVRNSLWLVEKVDPMVSAKVARHAATVQQQRLYATLAQRQAKWRRLLQPA